VKLVNQSGAELIVKRYDLPRKFSPGKANIDGVDQDIYQTEWKGIFYTYFLYKNVAVWVPGQLSAEAWIMKDVPEGWGADAPPEPRKAYPSTKKVEYEQDVNEDGTPATNEDGSPKYKLDAEGKPIVKAKPPKAPKAKKQAAAATPAASSADGSVDSVANTSADAPTAEPAAAPMRRRRGGEAGTTAA
jgi:hypothetical protein